MPRRSKGACLHLRPARYKAGKLTHSATWIIRDGAKYEGTGCLEHEIGKAEQALKNYIAGKYSPQRKERDIDAIPIADVLSIFIDDRPDLFVENPDGNKYVARMKRLRDFWGGSTDNTSGNQGLSIPSGAHGAQGTACRGSKKTPASPKGK